MHLCGLRWFRFTFYGCLLGLALLLPSQLPAETKPTLARTALVLDIKGPIGPAISDYVTRGLDVARVRGASLVILRMDTPGGLDTSMREIIQAILTSAVPVATFVAPGGARAASAGTYILYASHIAAMAPGTNLGAATPVRIGGGRQPLPFPKEKEKEEKKPPPNIVPLKESTLETTRAAAAEESRDAMEAKILNDAAAYIRSLAELRGRNVEWAEKAVREAVSLAASEAEAAKVIDFVATDLSDLLAKADGRTVSVPGGDRTLASAGLATETLEPDWRTNLLAVITNPNVAFILMLIGMYGIIFEFINPGSIYPGTIGAISLIIGLYAMHVLPVDYAGVALILLGIALMVAEAFVPSFGILGLGGTASFLIGATLLFDTDVPGLGLSWPVIIGTTAVSAGLLAIVLAMAVRAHRRPVVTGEEEMIGIEGEVIDWTGRAGRVLVHGESWQAEADRGFVPGDSVKVIERRGLTLTVAST